jgi:hypothetical protein
VADGDRTRSQQALTIPLSGERSLRVLREADAGELYALIAQHRSYLYSMIKSEWADLRRRDVSSTR